MMATDDPLSHTELGSLVDLLIDAESARMEHQRSPGPYLGFHVDGLQYTTYEDLMAASLRLEEALDAPLPARRKRTTSKSAARRAAPRTARGRAAANSASSSTSSLASCPWLVANEGNMGKTKQQQQQQKKKEGGGPRKEGKDEGRN